MILLLVGIAALFLLIERVFPANDLPATKGWWMRIAIINVIQAGLVVLAGLTWDRWFQSASIFSLRDHLNPIVSAAVAYVISTFVYYWWHRIRHESAFFWKLCHQLHHSPRRIEILASFYKHPVEITLNSLISGALIYLILGISVEAAALYTIFTAIAEYFYHWNIKTPRWLGPIFQRPESHRVHHKFAHHTQNYADLPIWDILFGTYHNPTASPKHCGFTAEREARFTDMLAFRDVHQTIGASEEKQTSLAPTCLGCRKRHLCLTQRQTTIKQSS